MSKITIEEPLKWIKEGMAENGTPFVYWDYLVNRARKKSIDSKRRVEIKLWEIMYPYVQGKGEKRDEKHKIGECRVGRTWLYWLLEK